MVGGIFCNLEKAFNRVNHKILFYKLEYYAINGKVQLWIESHIQNGYKRVKNTKADSNFNTFSNRAEKKTW